MASKQPCGTEIKWRGKVLPTWSLESLPVGEKWTFVIKWSSAKSPTHFHCQDCHSTASSTGLSSHQPQEGSLRRGQEHYNVVAHRKKDLLKTLCDTHLPPPPPSDERAATPPPNAEFLWMIICSVPYSLQNIGQQKIIQNGSVRKILESY